MKLNYKLAYIVGIVFVLVSSFSCASKICASKEKLEKFQNQPISEKGGDLSQMKKVKIYKPDGTLQCNQGRKISLTEMEKDLKGIQVFSAANMNDGMMRIQMCGTPTGDCNVYEILEEDLEKALSYGFFKWML